MFRKILLLLIVVSFFMIGLSGQERERRFRKFDRNKDDGAPKVGDVAPTFKLKLLDENLKPQDGKEIDLRTYNGKRPVVLIFGSYT